MIENGNFFRERIKMDFIGAALRKLNVTAEATGSMELQAPWRLERGGNGRPSAYYFLRGQGQIALAGEDDGPLSPRPIEAGDLIFVSRGEKHVLQHAASADRPTDLAANGPASGKSSLAMGSSHFLHVTVQAEIGRYCPFVSALPSLLFLKAGDRADYPYLEAQLQNLAWESATHGSASDLLLARLWEVMFLLAFRTYLARATHHSATGWLAAIRDPQLTRALTVMQMQPEAPWTVERLAEEALMSRATFVRQFTRIMGEPPLHFLYLHRMGLAAGLLQQGERNIAEIAAQVGYGSEAAFSNAFRRHFGSPPGAYRTAHSAGLESGGRNGATAWDL